MLSAQDALLVVATTVLCTAVVTALAWLLLRLNRRGSIASQFVIVVAAAIASVACSTVVVLAEMFFSGHDLLVLGWVLGVSAALSLGAAWFVTARVARRSVAGLVAQAQRIGAGVDPEAAGEAAAAVVAPGWREFDELAEQLSESSARLDAARAELARADAARRQFLAWIAHDLRTPLTGIRAMAEALETGGVDEPEAYARRIRDRVDAVSQMVDDLFELSTLESGALRLRRETVDLLDLVSDAVSDVQGLAAARGIRIQQSGVAGRMLWGDPRELTRAIGNLLANGVRHAPDGSEILVSAMDRDDGHLVLSILDQGSGVSTEDLGRMFEVGWRGDAARTSAEQRGGAGLGLAIVRGIIQAHGGQVSARHVDGGFRLDVVIPTGAGSELV